MQWTQVYLGVGMAALSGVVAWDVWDQPYPLAWRAAATAMAGLLFVFSGLYLRELHQRALKVARPAPELAAEEQTASA